MRALQLIIIFTILLLSIPVTMQADHKVTMLSGDVYLGEITDESNSYIELKLNNSDITIEIEKSKIESIKPALCRIVTDENYEIYGYIMERERRAIKVKTSDGVLLEVDPYDVTSIEYIDENDFNDWTDPVPHIRKIETPEVTEEQEPKINNTDLKSNQPNVQNDSYSQYYEQTLNKNFPYVGITLGTPGIFNAAFGYHIDNVILELKAGASDEYAGVQGAMLINIYETNDCVFGMSLGLNLGYMSHKRKNYIKYMFDEILTIEELNIHDEYAFTGANFRIQWYGVTLDIGIATSIMNDNYYVDESFALVNLGYMYYFN